jgi:hypothetical protein
VAIRPVRVSVTTKDAKGTEASTAIYGQADDSGSLAVLMAQVEDTILTITNLQTGGFVRASFVVEPFTTTAPPTNLAAPGSKVELTALFGFSATGTTKRWSAVIPAFGNGISAPLLGDRINLDDEYVGYFTAGMLFTGDHIQWTNDRNQPLVALQDALLATRRHRKQLQRSSFEV